MEIQKANPVSVASGCFTTAESDVETILKALNRGRINRDHWIARLESHEGWRGSVVHRNRQAKEGRL